MMLPHLTVKTFKHPLSAICCGVADLGTRVSREASFRLLDAYVETGGRFFDTAHCYACWLPGGLGASERTLGEYLGSRALDDVVVATKGGHPAFPPHYPRPRHFLAPELISRDIDESLDRLRRDQVELYYLHRDDGHTPVGEIVDALNEPLRQGRIGALGASNWSVARLAAANAWAAANGRTGFVALQNQWSLATPTWRATEDPTVRYLSDEDAATLASLNVAVIPYSSTANGYFATGGVKGEAFQTAENAQRLRRAEALAEEKGATANQIALAWLMSHPFPVVPIVGTVNPEHLQDALAAATLRLSGEEIRWLMQA